MNYAVLAPLVRHALQALGGFLAARGYIDESMTDAFIGIGVNAFTLGWYLIERRLKRKPTPDFKGEQV